MNIHILLNTDIELVAFETMNLAFLLASFDNGVQIELGATALSLLSDKNARLVGLLKSLHLYDLPPAWVMFDTDFYQHCPDDNELRANLTQKPSKLPLFDSFLTF